MGAKKSVKQKNVGLADLIQKEKEWKNLGKKMVHMKLVARNVNKMEQVPNILVKIATHCTPDH